MNYVIDENNSLVNANIQEIAFNAAHPVGEIYIQYPGKKDPQTLYGRGIWTNKSSEFAGLFFRAEGGNASEFYTGTVDDGNALPDENKQEDKIRNINSVFSFITEVTSSAAGASRVTPINETGGGGIASGSAFVAGWGRSYFYFDANQQIGPTINSMAGHADGPEIRPVNTTIRVWERTG